MISRALSHRRGWFIGIVVTSIALGALGCCYTHATRTASGRGSASLNQATLKCDVQVVAVLSDGRTIPPTVRVRRNIQIVIWAADADMLQIKFPNGNPFGGDVPCQGRFCGYLVPPSKPGTYKYNVEVTTDGVTRRNDPQMEVWD